MTGTNLHINPDGMSITNPYENLCTCDMFGQGQMVITFYKVGSAPVPNRWVRFWCSVFFNTKWKFVK